MPTYTPVTAPEIQYMRQGENLVKSGQFAPLLEEGETLTGSPTCTSSPVDGLTISSVQISGTEVKARINPDDDLDDTDFEILWTVETTLSDGVTNNTRQILGRLKVRER